MTNWYQGGALEAGPGLADLPPVQKLGTWEQYARAAADLFAQEAIDDWNTFDTTGTYPRNTAAELTLWDGCASLFDLYHYFGKTDQLWLDGAVAMANTYEKWARVGLRPDSTQQPYKPTAPRYYPFGVASLYNFNNSLLPFDVPEYFRLLVENQLWGEATNANMDRDNLTREASLSIKIYVSSVRVGNTLPTDPSRLNELIGFIKEHCRRWVEAGPERGIDPYTWGWKYNEDGSLGSDNPAIKNMASFMWTLNSHTMAQVKSDLRPNDTEAWEWQERVCDWLGRNGVLEGFSGAFFGRVLNCEDCNDPLVIEAGSNTSNHCTQTTRNCWHLSNPLSQNVQPLDFDVVNGQNTVPFAELYLRTGQRKWADILDMLWNGQFARGDERFRKVTVFNGKQFNQSIGHGLNYLKARHNQNIYTTYFGGPVS